MTLQIMGARLKALRKAVKQTQKDIADLIGISPSHYQKIEYGRINIPVSTLAFLADFYNVSTDYLLGRTDDPTP